MNKNTHIKFDRNHKSLKTGTKKVISQNPIRNMQMVVERNTDEKGKKYSKTFHCKINLNEPCDPKPRRDNRHELSTY
jgi:hypothetical protein